MSHLNKYMHYDIMMFHSNFIRIALRLSATMLLIGNDDKNDLPRPLGSWIDGR